MDDRLKCNIIPKLWGFGALWDQCHLIPKAIRTVRLLQSVLLHSAALLWQGEREASNSSFAMKCLISRMLKCEHQIKKLGLRSTVALSQGRGRCTRFKEIVECQQLSLGVCLSLRPRPGRERLCFLQEILACPTPLLRSSPGVPSWHLLLFILQVPEMQEH